MQQSCQRCGKRFTQTGADKYCPACREELDSAQKKQVEPINEDVRRVDVSLRHLPNRNVTAA